MAGRSFVESLADWNANQYLRDLPWSRITPEVGESDQRIYETITSTNLSEQQANAIAHPGRSFPSVKHVLAVHWHPEFVPLGLIRERIDHLYPNRVDELIIPTQHNQLLEWDGYSGVEVDCYATEFKEKIQILLHFASSSLDSASKLKAMLDHTFRYRSSQLFEFLDTLIEENMEHRLLLAAQKTAASEELIRFTRIHARRLRRLIRDNEARTEPTMIKNKLVRNYFDRLRDQYDDRLIDQVQEFARRVKKIVKANFDPSFFFTVQEVIEEARLHNPIIIVPHPEQSWPVLLADYDVDGFEVWNPQSQDYTEFMIGVVHRLNTARPDRHPILAMMGDDCHMGEKTKPKDKQDPVKSVREIGLQPAWDELPIRKSLVLGNIRKESLIEEYRQRLQG